MPFPIKACKICGEDFELKSDHPGYANRCRDCNEPSEAGSATAATSAFESTKEANAARRAAIKDILYSGK